ncbi:MAG: serine protease [Treponema sp.]|nr:serine protease [Treponema sp.]
MIRKSIVTIVLFFLASAFCFGQASVLRDYVGLISIHYHSDVVAYMGKFKDSFEKKGYSNAAKAVDDYLKGLSGSGFVYVAPDGTNYVLTNAHVIAQSESLSITFEKLDGSKTIYDRLKVLYADEDKDLALLVFADGVKPFTQGLSFSGKPADEGGDVFAAGFPGLANTAIWQFSKGTVSNAAVRLPKSSDSDETVGPFIQHTAQIDPGNSGGPLLVTAPDVPAGYAVVGINTLSALRRQAANYAIPADQIQAFINTALSKEPVNDRELIAKKVDDFIKGLMVNKAVYGHIAQFISNNCTASNAEFAVSELLDKAPRTVVEDVLRTFANDPVTGMNAAVAWYIESNMRSKTGALKINLDSITANDKGNFDVVFNVNGALVKSEWIKEYGVYRMDTYGDTVTGNKTLLEEKKKKKELNKALRTDYSFAISAGYSYVFNYGSALYAGIRFYSPFTYGFDLFYGFGNKEYFQFGMKLGYYGAIRMDTFAIMPFGELGLSYVSSYASKNLIPVSLLYNEPAGFKFAMALPLQAGVMLTTAAVPGLFGKVYFTYNIIVIKDKYEWIKNHAIFGLSVGYGF